MHDHRLDADPKADTPRAEEGLFARLRRGAQRGAAVILAVGLVAAVLGAAAVVAVAFFAIAALATVAVGLAWLVARVMRPRRRGQRGPEVLTARKGPRGWTVDVAGGS